MDYAIYMAAVIGAVSLFLMMPRQGYNPRKLGALLGAATLGGFWLWLSRGLGEPSTLGLPIGTMVYYYIFSAIAIAAAVRVITHDKPVFSALWFVMVVLSSAGLFILLSAEFMAFAMIIIYGGAILVTYVFVIMLAAQTGDPNISNMAEYDRVAREPVAAIAAGFLLLAVLLTVMFNTAQIQANPLAKGPSDLALIENVLVNRPEETIAGLAQAEGKTAPEATVRLDNAERIGVDLFQARVDSQGHVHGHLLSLELAGVILLVSLVGAVVIARKQVDEEAGR